MKKEFRSMKVVVLGEGAWGTAIATVLAHKGHQVHLWCHHKELVPLINTTHTNERFLPGIVLDKKIQAIASLQEALHDASVVFEAIPVKFLRSVLNKAKPWVHTKQQWVVLSKGIEQETLLFPSQIIDDVFEKKITTSVVAGPSFAMDLAQQQITGVTIAAATETRANALCTMMATNYFRPYISTDVMGVQVGAALKNVIAIGIGMLDGAGYGDNTKAFLFTRGLHEMMKVSRMVGGKKQTIYGLSGVGDLLLSSMGTLSRNLSLGRQLGQGQPLAEIIKNMETVPEGINTIQSLYQFIQKKDVNLPICRGIYEMIFLKVPLKDFLQEITGQPLGKEFE